ncbi:MAG: hypothetical protein GKC06_04545 [Methanomicrobiales archaeon]|nr:hypothetical protein [Methanomicrobiales archaeon]
MVIYDKPGVAEECPGINDTVDDDYHEDGKFYYSKQGSGLLVTIGVIFPFQGIESDAEDEKQKGEW